MLNTLSSDKERYMKSRLCIIVLLLTSISATILAYAQGPKRPRNDADYRARTLSELNALQPEYILNNPEYKAAVNLRVVAHYGDLLPSRVKVLYDGTTRPLVANKKYLIAEWANRFAGMPGSYIDPYQTEMLFTENGKDHWLVVRNDSLSKFEQELQKGDAVELFLIKLGNVYVDDNFEPVLLVDKFVKHTQ